MFITNKNNLKNLMSNFCCHYVKDIIAIFISKKKKKKKRGRRKKPNNQTPNKQKQPLSFKPYYLNTVNYDKTLRDYKIFLMLDNLVI